MSNGYIESSLKRFLKRKVKVTLGLIVAFMITGTVGFGAEEGTIEWHKQQADEWLAGRGQKALTFDEVTAGDTIITNTDGGITITFKDTGSVVISEDDISEKVSGNIQTALDLISGKNISGTGYGNGFEEGLKLENIGEVEEKKPAFVISGEGNVFVNTGTLAKTQRAEKGAVIVNKGKIIFTGNYSQRIDNKGYNYGIIANNGQFGQYIVGTGYNYGIIINNAKYGQHIGNKGYNYGIIANNDSYGQNIGNNGIGYNYGIIKNAKDYGQTINGQATIGYNYGIVANNGNYGQNIISNGIGYNYGIINNQKNYGQYIENSKGFNYGVIENKGTYGQYIVSGNSYNYGIIANEGEYGICNKNGVAINYGVIKNSSNNIFSGNVINNGVIIFDSNETSLNNIGTGTNNGVVLNNDYSFSNVTYRKEKVNKDVTNLNDVSSPSIDGTADKTYYTLNDTKNDTKEFSNNLTNNVLTAVITKNGGTAYKYNDNDEKTSSVLTLDGTTVMGYFADGGTGTLLEIGKGDSLTLVNSKINAVTDIGNSQNVTAVNLNGGTLTQVGESEIVGKIEGKGTAAYIALKGENQNISLDSGDVTLTNDNKNEYSLGDENYTDIIFNTLKADNLVLTFDIPNSQNTNKITINNGELQSINGNSSSEKIELTIDNTVNVKDITLGTNGDDKLTVIGYTNSNYENVFDYKIENTENVVLTGNNWHVGNNAENKGGLNSIKIADNSSLQIDVNNNFGKGDATTSLDKLAEGGSFELSTGTKNSTVKFVVGEEFNVNEKIFNVATNYQVITDNIQSAVIFDAVKDVTNGNSIKITVKDAEELGLGDYKEIYDAVLGELSENNDLRYVINNSKIEKFTDMITEAGDTAEALYTTGYAVTKDVTDTYMSVVEDFGRKAGKGEWIAHGKYVNTDSEFDGDKSSKGYDGDITGTVGMLEYGLTDATSYGAVFGMGDTEVDINGGGKLDGDNYYAGAYVKHRTKNGIDLLGNVGYTKSELDLNLATTVGNSDYHIITDGNSDAEALTFSLKGRKDYRIFDSVILQPVAGLRYSFINQDTVESKDADFRMDGQDVEVFEGLVGGNIIKEFDISNGKLSLMAGAEFVLTEVNENDNVKYTLYGKNIELTEEEEIADNRVEAHVGAEYIHENGVGVDVKYEFVWTDKGDSDRITAGVSYKF